MRSLVSKLVLAALVAAALPAAALAHDRDGDEGRAAYAPQPDPYGAPPRWRDGRWRYGWRERELAEVRAEMRQLEARRAEFYEHGAWNPGRVRRFERWYAFRRAELERRWNALQQVAWR